jgi:hypothetical protein
MAGFRAPLPKGMTGAESAKRESGTAVSLRQDPIEPGPPMSRLSTTLWEIAACLAGAALLGAGAYRYATRKRPTPEELELARRILLVQHGRIVDGTLLEVREIEATSGPSLTLIFFSYRIGGVNYECSQDITLLCGIVDITQIRAGFPCSVRYQPGKPQNSIVVAEGWSGMRMGLPVQPRIRRTEPVELDPMRAEHGRPQTQS